MSKYNCVECGRDCEGMSDRCILPYRCSGCRDTILKKVEAVLGIQGHQYTEFSYDIPWGDLKSILDAFEHNTLIRGWFYPDKARRENMKVER